jgi:4-amino-4-deoxy-L-arabinose transferase-like glycosyltransferase
VDGETAMGSRAAKNLLISIVALAFGTRLAVAILTTSWVFPSDGNFWTFGHEMGQVAASLAMGNGFSWPDWSSYPEGPTSWMAPVYPFIMAGAFKLFGIYTKQAAIALELFLTIVSAMTCILLYSLGKRLYNAQVGLIAAFILAIYPPSIYLAVRNLWDTSLFTFCLLAIILMFLKLADKPDLKKGIYLGVMLGFTALVNPIIVGASSFAFIWLYLNANSTRNTIIKTMALMLTFFCLTISPWLVRNYLVFGHFVFIKSNFGRELFVGTRDAPFRVENPMGELTEAERQFLAQSDEATRNKFFLEKAIIFITEHPLRFIQQVMFRFTRFWTYMSPRGGWQEKISLALYLILLLLAVAGLLSCKPKGQDVQLSLLLLLTIPLPYYLTTTVFFRYRFPVEPILMIFAGYTIYKLAILFFLKETVPESSKGLSLES